MVFRLISVEIALQAAQCLFRALSPRLVCPATNHDKVPWWSKDKLMPDHSLLSRTSYRQIFLNHLRHLAPCNLGGQVQPFTSTPAPMSDPYTRKTQDTPPSRNFSHPNRHRAPNLSPSQYQNSHNHNRPPMAPNDSRHMLPLMPDAIFTRDTSNFSLHSERHPYNNIDFSYISPHRLGTSQTAISSYSTPDLTLTALPQLPPVPPIPQPFECPPPVTINPPSPRRLVRSRPRSPTKSAKSTKGGGWRRLGRKVKEVFSFVRQRKRNSTHSDGERRGLVIGEPYAFVHRETHGVGPLRPSGPATVGARTMAPGVAGGESWGVGMSGGLGCGLGDRPSTGYDSVVGARHRGISGGAGFGGLGNLDVEGTAVSDDEDSTWEDCEATRLFIAHQESLGRKT